MTSSKPRWVDAMEADSLLSARRETMVMVLREAGLSVLVAGHEHAYERAALVCGDAVMICVVSGGAGSPLHSIPTGEEAGRMFASYELPDCRFEPENVFANISFNYSIMRFWFGGGDLTTYAVEKDGSDVRIDHIAVDLKRFGVPELDQQKIPIRPSEGPRQPAPSEESSTTDRNTAPADSASAVKPVTKPSSQPGTTPPGGR